MKKTDNVDIKDKVQIEVSTMNWGPCVVKLRILDDFKKILLDEARNTEIDFRDKLAGQIAKERGYNEKQREKIIPFLSTSSIPKKLAAHSLMMMAVESAP